MKEQSPKNGLFKRTPLKFYIVAALVLILMVEMVPAILDFLKEVETWNFTERQKAVISSRVEQNIAIIGIDDRTLSSGEMRGIFGKWPYPRNVYPYVIRFLNRGKDVKVIAFDISFDGGEDLEHPDRDQAFAQAVNTSEVPVIAAVTPMHDDASGSPIPDSFRNYNLQFTGSPDKTGFQNRTSIRSPIQPLLDSAMKFYSSASLWNDEAGIARQVILFAVFNDRTDQVFPTFTLAMALNGERQVEVLENRNIKTPARIFNLKGERFPYIRWYGDVRGARPGVAADKNRFTQGFLDQRWGPITRFIVSHWLDSPLQLEPPPIYRKYSFADIVLSEMALECRENPDLSFCAQLGTPEITVTPETFDGNYVLIGTTGNNLADVHKTIYGTGPYPGVYIQANMLDNLLHDDFVYKLDPVWAWVGVLLLSGLTIRVCLRLPIPFSIVFVTVLAGSYTIFTIWAYRELSWWVNWTYPMLALFLAFAGSYVYRYFSAEQRKQQLRYAFAKYVSPAVMQTIEKNPEQISLGGQRRELTMLFSDIRGFTTFSETHEAEFVQSFLTDYFSVMNNIVLNECGGSINKLIGDAIMAYWGFPLETEDHAYQAVRAALKMRDTMHEWNRRDDRPPVRIGVGINTGEVMIGNVGSKDFMDFTVIGDAVNTAARLEGMNKEMKTNIIISEYTYAKVRGRLLARPLGAVSIRGKEQKLQIYEPIAFREDLTDDQVRAIEEELFDASTVISQAEGA